MSPQQIAELELEEGCGFCGGPFEVLGTLGRRVQLRCRDCAGDFSVAGPEPLVDREAC